MADINDLKDICISSGTLRAEDLLPRFMGILKDYAPEKFNEFIKGYPELDGWEEFLHDDWRLVSDDTKVDACDALFGLLNDIAPEGTMFSSTEGDGADFGFWSVEEKLLDDDEGEQALKQMAKDGKSTGEVAADIRYDVATALDMAADKAEDLMTKFGLDNIYVLRAKGLSPKAIANKILKACEPKDEGWLGGFYSRQDVLDAMDGGILNKDWKLEKRFGNWGCYVNQNTGRPLVLQVMVSKDRNGDWGYKPVTSDMGPVDTNIQAAKWLKPRLEEWVEKNPDRAKDVPDYEWGWIEKCLGKETANKAKKDVVKSLVEGDRIKLIDTVADGAVVEFVRMLTPSKMLVKHNGREMGCKTSFIDHKIEKPTESVFDDDELERTGDQAPYRSMYAKDRKALQDALKVAQKYSPDAKIDPKKQKIVYNSPYGEVTIYTETFTGLGGSSDIQTHYEVSFIMYGHQHMTCDTLDDLDIVLKGISAGVSKHPGDSWDDFVRNVKRATRKPRAKRSEANNPYYGYGKDDAIDKDDNDFMWQVAYDWFEERLPEAFKRDADRAVTEVIDSDMRAYEEIVTMDDYYDYLEIYGPAVIEEITGDLAESKKTESSGADLASLYGDGDVSTHENSADGFYVDEHDPMGFAVLNNDTATMEELFSGKAVAPEKPWTYAGWHEDIDAPENNDGSYPYVYDWEREYDLNFVNDWKRVVGDKDNEEALKLLLKYAPDFIPSAMDFWNAFHAGYSKGLLRKLFNNIFAVVDKDDPYNNYLGYGDYTYDEVAKFLDGKGESRKFEGEDEEAFGKFEDAVKSILMDKYGVVDSHGPSNETANSLVLQYGATLRDAFDKGGENGYDPTSVALLIITRQLREAPQFFDDCKNFSFNKDSKKSESLTLKQKELKDMARYGEAEDITTISDAEAKELKKKGIETVGVSRGTYGMNGALLRDREGNKYVITARSSNLFYFV